VVAARDGHQFVADARVRGAAAYLTAGEPEGGTAVRVPDTVAALHALGGWARGRMADRVVGITGSSGKTSTKDLLAAALGRRWATAASDRSHNNELGVPLTLLNGPDEAEAAVVEMGARAPGDIAVLCQVARPTVGVVTNVGVAHLEGFVSPEAVAEEKGTLVAFLTETGTAVLNADDPVVRGMAERTVGRVLTYGRAGGDVRAVDVRLDAELRPSFRLVSPGGEAEVRLAARGEHQVLNALAAATAALVCDVPLADVVAGLAEARLSPWRMELARARSGALVLNDAYNANPDSVTAALRALAQLDATRRIAVLGPMAELGPVSEQAHREVGALARELGIDRVIAVGAPEIGGDVVPDVEAALAALGDLHTGDAVLVKASRVAGLERVVTALLEAKVEAEA